MVVYKSIEVNKIPNEWMNYKHGEVTLEQRLRGLDNESAIYGVSVLETQRGCTVEIGGIEEEFMNLKVQEESLVKKLGDLEVKMRGIKEELCTIRKRD